MGSMALAIVGMVIIFALAAVVYFGFLRPKKDFSQLLKANFDDQGRSDSGKYGSKTEQELDKITREVRKKASQKTKVTFEQKFFQAGIFSEKDKQKFKQLRIILPCILVPVIGIGAGMAGPQYLILGGILGLLAGLQLPSTILDKRIENRGEEIMYYLPLVIEQISIGVSSSLDIGPCLQRIVQMADERDSHNVVTELIRHVQYYVKSGVSLEESLMEIGILSGHNELKHSFMSLSQVAKHGGEISRQLQELADAVSGQRETAIDAKINKLELLATGPVAVVFVGFIIILMIGFGLQLQGAFG